jgi:hypothetical protein
LLLLLLVLRIERCKIFNHIIWIWLLLLVLLLNEWLLLYWLLFWLVSVSKCRPRRVIINSIIIARERFPTRPPSIISTTYTLSHSTIASSSTWSTFPKFKQIINIGYWLNYIFLRLSLFRLFLIIFTAALTLLSCL